MALASEGAAQMTDLAFGAREATPDDARAAYDRYMGIARKRGYTVGITGSTLFGDGGDVDLIVLVTEDASTASAASVANEFLAHKEHLYYYEQEEDGSSAAGVFRQSDGVVIDFYIVGLAEGG